MSLMAAIILGLIQGLTEFLPISSSAHLIFVPAILKLPPTPLFFDVSLHLATLGAVLFFFASEIKMIIKGLRKRDKTARSIAFMLMIGTVPAVIVGLILKPFFDKLKNPSLAAVFLVLTGAILWWADSQKDNKRLYTGLQWYDALFIGIGQAAAIVPGISRSGATIAAGLARGLTREQSARFSFLLAIPAILGAGILEAKDLILAPQMFLPVYLWGILTAGISGYLAIKYFIRFLHTKPLRVFAYYCWAVGLCFLAFSLFFK